MVANRICFLLLYFLSQTLFAATHYQLGRGLQFDNGLHLGGYSGVDFRFIDDQKSRLDIREFSLFVHWTRQRWQLFAELEVENLLTYKDGGLTTGQSEFSLERLYVDYRLQPQLKIRLGKYLTPIGRWNQLHAPPLVWTVFRPLVSRIPFARNSTGLSLQGTINTKSNSFDYTFFADNSKLFDHYRDEDAFQEAAAPKAFNAFDNAIGTHLNYSLWDDHLALGISLVSFRMREFNERKHLIGIDWHWLKEGYEFNAEAFYRYSDGQSEIDAWGVFVQWVAPLPHDIFAVISHEMMNSGLTDSKIQISSLGFAYRPLPPLVFKFEYHESDKDNLFLADDGWLLSIAVLF